MPGSPSARERLRSWVAGAADRLGYDGLLSIGSFGLAFAVYRSTLLPVVSAWDTAEAQAVPVVLGTMHPTGFPSYTLLGFVASVVLTPFGDPALRLNLFSALLVAMAAGVVTLLLRRLDAPPTVAVAAGAGFAMTPAVWRLGVAADVHALHVGLVALIVLCLARWNALVQEARETGADAGADGRAVAGATGAKADDGARAAGAAAAGAGPADAGAGADGGAAVIRRRADRLLVGTAALFGVALGNHALTLLLVPAVGLYVLAVDARTLLRPRLVVAAVGACIGVTALLYLELPLRGAWIPAPLVYGTPGTWDGFLEVALGRQFQGDFMAVVADPIPALGRIGAEWLADLGVLAALVIPAFVIVAVRHPRFALLSGTAVAITCLFASSYYNAAIDRYYAVPMLLAWVWLGLAAAAVVERVAENAGLADVGIGDMANAGAEAAGSAEPAPFMVPLTGGRIVLDSPISAVALLLAVAMLVPTAVDLSVRWRATDRSNETQMAAWLDTLFEVAPQDAVVVSWWSYSTTIWYGQAVEGRRPDIRVVDDRTREDQNLGTVIDVIDANLSARPVYVIRAQASDLQDVAARFTIEPVDRLSEVYRVTGRLESQP